MKLNKISNLFNHFIKKETKPFLGVYKSKLDNQIIDNSFAISFKSKFLYNRIYKVANSTIVATLYYAETGIKLNNLESTQRIKDEYFPRPSIFKRKDITKLKLLFKFTFVRNPYERIVSCYLDKIRNQETSQKGIVLRHLGKENNDDISFNEFLDFLENGGLFLNGHWAPQSEFLVLPLQEYDYIGKLERFNEEFPEVLYKIFKRNIPIVSIKEHRTKSKSMSLELTIKQRNRIFNLYKSDFFNFSYPK